MIVCVKSAYKYINIVYCMKLTLLYSYLSTEEADLKYSPISAISLRMDYNHMLHVFFSQCMSITIPTYFRPSFNRAIFSQVRYWVGFPEGLPKRRNFWRLPLRDFLKAG